MAISVVIAIGGLLVAIHLRHEIHWGDAPTWTAAVAAVVAGIYAVKTFTSQNEQLKEQQDYISKQSELIEQQMEVITLERDERRSAQARQVILAPRPVALDPEKPGYFRAAAVVENGSDSPIKAASLNFGSIPASSARLTRISQSGTDTRETVASIPVPVVGPGVRFLFEVWHTSVDLLRGEAPSVTFEDAAGRHWTLDEHQDLKLVLSRPTAS
ncbi:hypothetical protein [Kitasatospora sp. NPDC057936]|uniref:hypothetical protein n=1 Tax=Kitasatospora sp. NPDC057936 TaxID=3346283 RepID=UPI0036DCE98B